jgi:hypothetical protein
MVATAIGREMRINSSSIGTIIIPDLPAKRSRHHDPGRKLSPAVVDRHRSDGMLRIEIKILIIGFRTSRGRIPGFAMSEGLRKVGVVLQAFVMPRIEEILAQFGKPPLGARAAIADMDQKPR